MKRPLFLYACLAVAVMAIGVGLSMSGSPARARAKRYDQQRVTDLQQISYALDQYWSSNSRLPASVSDLMGRGDEYYLPSIRDPRTAEMYEYRPLTVTSPGNYELCATFDTTTQTPSSAGLARPIDQPFWQHGVGRVCFPFQIRTLNIPAR